MKETIRTATDLPKFKDYLRAALWQVCGAACGFLGARGVLPGALTPFGLSFAAGVPVPFAPVTALGALAGAFLPTAATGAFRYLAALFAVFAVRLLLWNRRRLDEHPLFCAALMLAVEIITAGVSDFGIRINILPQICEAALATGGAFCVARTAAALRRRPLSLGMNEVAMLFLCLAMLQIGACNLTFFGVSAGRILGVFILLSAARYGGTRSGAAAGIAVGFADLLAGVSPVLCCLYAFGGLVAGLCTVAGKYAQVLGFFFAVIIGCLATGQTQTAVYYALDIFFAAMIFLAMPRRFFAVCNPLLCVQPKISSAVGSRQDMALRLTAAAGALQDVARTVGRVSSELGQPTTPDYSKMIDETRHEVCGDCKLRAHCWESRKADTLAALCEMSKAVRCGSNSPETAAPAEFRARCMQPQAIGKSVWRTFSEMAVRVSKDCDLCETQKIISDQLEGIAGLLGDLNEDLQSAKSFDYPTAVNFAAGLEAIGLHPEECGCSTNPFGRMQLRFQVKKEAAQVLNRSRIKSCAEQVCDREFDVPSVVPNGNRVFVQLTERATFRIDFGACQLPANGHRLCGDSFRSFADGAGRFFILLSDGMGTGGHAAVDSTMVAGLMARLLKSGFSAARALKILNGAMLYKSSDESLATVDIAEIDLFTGDTVIHKAGSAPTFARRSGAVGMAESHSLPVGILREICFDKARVHLRVGDVLVMLSDGALCDGTDWIKAEIDAFGDGSAEDLASRIATQASRRCPQLPNDDITVLCALMQRNF